MNLMKCAVKCTFSSNIQITNSNMHPCGWDTCFYLMGSTSLLWTLAWAFLAHDSPKLHPSITEEVTVPCESLDSREFSRIFLKFHFSISISSHFYFTFTSRSRFPVIFISLSFLEKSERDKNFTLFLEKKRVKFYTKFHEKFNHSSIEGEEPKTNYVRNNEWRYPTVHSRYDNK